MTTQTNRPPAPGSRPAGSGSPGFRPGGGRSGPGRRTSGTGWRSSRWGLLRPGRRTVRGASRETQVLQPQEDLRVLRRSHRVHRLQRHRAIPPLCDRQMEDRVPAQDRRLLQAPARARERDQAREAPCLGTFQSRSRWPPMRRPRESTPSYRVAAAMGRPRIGVAGMVRPRTEAVAARVAAAVTDNLSRVDKWLKKHRSSGQVRRSKRQTQDCRRALSCGPPSASPRPHHNWGADTYHNRHSGRRVRDHLCSPSPAGDCQGRDVSYTRGDMVKLLRLRQKTLELTQAQGLRNSDDIFQALQLIVENEIISQAAPGQGISVSKEEVDNRLRTTMAPTRSESLGKSTLRSSAEFNERYRQFLNTTQVSSEEHRDLVRRPSCARSSGSIWETRYRHTASRSMSTASAWASRRSGHHADQAGRHYRRRQET